MKQFLLLLLLVCSFLATYSQTNQWAWMSGDSIPNQRSIYGVKGVASASVKPGARYSAVSWTDPAGSLWLFGGSMNGGSGYLNDLWKYDPGTGWWTWVSGDSIPNQAGIYGIRGVPAATNMPGGRQNAVSWADRSGNLWLFGGYFGGSYMNDLWKFDPATRQWTWVSGANTAFQVGFYGIKGAAGPLNVPGARYSATSFTDASGNLWLFGGIDFAASGFGYLNDLWKFEPATGYWTWMSGDNVEGQPGIYGIQGTPAPANKPGARYGMAGWSDHAGNLWLFGGFGFTGGPLGYMNDLWKYTPSTGQWTWVSGDNARNPVAVYGTKGLPAAGNKPGALYYPCTWTDPANNLWLFGGYGGGALNALWKFAPATNQWTWVSGDSTVFQYGIYGTRGTADAANKPGARSFLVSWTDPTGNFWLFGGDGYAARRDGTLNDLWKYTFSSQPGASLFAGFTAQKQQQTAVLNWTTNQEQNTRLFVVERYASGGVYDSIGVVPATGTTSSITPYSFIDKSPLAGTNFYRIRQMDQTGTSLFSTIAQVMMSQIQVQFSIIQNPVQSTLIVSVQLPVTQKLTLKVEDMNGRLLIYEAHTGDRGGSVFYMPVDRLGKGTYILHIQSESISSTRMFIKL